MCLTGQGKLQKHPAAPDLGVMYTSEMPKDVLTGWRVWKVNRSSGKTRLRAVFHPHDWEPHRAMTAGAPLKTDPSGVGVYAVNDRKFLHRIGGTDTQDRDIVVGLVGLWGDVSHHPEGYKAENGYPLRLWTNDVALQAKLRDSYGVSVRRLSAKSMLKEKVAA